MKSNLEIPKAFSKFLSIYLLISIGFKGGSAITHGVHESMDIWILCAFGIALSFLQPFIIAFILPLISTLNRPTNAAIAASYGSISLITFITATSFLKDLHLEYDERILAIVVLMEIPAIFSGLLIAHFHSKLVLKTSIKEGMLEVARNGAVILLVGSFVIGLICSAAEQEKLQGFFVGSFYGLLSLFLLDMGLNVAKELKRSCKLTPALVVFAVVCPLISSVFSAFLCNLTDLDLGTKFLFVVLVSSASYIAVPAAMKIALPEAKSSVYMPLSLGVTFTFNVIIGVPLYWQIINIFSS